MYEKLSLLPVVGLLLLGSQLFTQATPATAQSQLRVEVMVFAYPGGGTSEQWEAMPELAYPAPARLLIDSRGQAGMNPAAGIAGQAVSPTTPSGALPGPVPEPASTAFTLLPASEREFGARAASLQASGRYRILFHEAWVQPMPAKSTAVPLVLDRSGEGGAWPELQGSITLYQAGDFVLETNLWLNTGGEYLPGTWRMPSPPRGPGSIGPEPRDAPSAAQQQVEASVDEVGDYPYRHAVLLRQSRRIRSGEVTYIDHPMLGVVAKITPLDEPADAATDIAETPPAF